MTASFPLFSSWKQLPVQLDLYLVAEYPSRGWVEGKRFGYVWQLAVLIRVLSSLGCVQISRGTPGLLGYSLDVCAVELPAASSSCDSFVSGSGFPVGLWMLGNRTWSGWGKRRGPYLGGLLVLSVPTPASTAGPEQGCAQRCGLWVSASCRGAWSGVAPELEMKLLCPTQIVSLMWDVGLCFLLKEEDGGGLFSVNWKGALERCHQSQHCGSQYAA